MLPGAMVRKFVIWTLLLVATLTVLSALLTGAPALAQDDGGDEETEEGEEGEEAPGNLEVRVFSGRGDDRVGVDDVGVTAESPSGELFEGVTDSDGTAVIAVEEVGPDAEYSVTIDPGTLPEEMEVDEEELTRDGITVLSGQTKVTNFRVGEDEGGRQAPSRWSRIGSLAVAGVKLGAIVALAAVGLSLVFGVTGLVNFSHGELVTMGAVIAYFFNTGNAGPTWHILIAAIPAVAIGAAFGWAQERVLWRPMRRRRTGTISILVVSIGLMFAMQYTILWIFHGQPRSYAQFAVQTPMSAFQPVNVVPKTIWIVGISIAVLVAVGMLLLKTKLGTAMRAVADNPDLARSSGIDVDRVILVVWMMGGGLAALGGVLFGISEQVQWQMGFKLLLGMFAAVVLGGLGTAFGAMLGGFVIGFTIEVSTYVVPTELKFAVGLAVLVVMLLVRPQGLLGHRERIG